MKNIATHFVVTSINLLNLSKFVNNFLATFIIIIRNEKKDLSSFRYSTYFINQLEIFR